MQLSTDSIIVWQHDFFKLNVTLITTWVLMFVLVLGSKLITQKLKGEVKISRWQCAFEILIVAIQKQIEAIGLKESDKYLSFLATLFLFIAMANLFTIFPGYEPPTGSLSTTTALAICVFVAVPLFGIDKQGFIAYIKSYFKPSFIMLPFNIMGELSRTLALAIRLFGNMMSGSIIIAILLSVTPFIFPIIMSVLGLLTGMVQAYIFSVLAAVYIAAAVHAHHSGGTDG